MQYSVIKSIQMKYSEIQFVILQNIINLPVVYNTNNRKLVLKMCVYLFVNCLWRCFEPVEALFTNNIISPKCVLNCLKK